MSNICVGLTPIPKCIIRFFHAPAGKPISTDHEQKQNTHVLQRQTRQHNQTKKAGKYNKYFYYNPIN